MNDEQTHVGLPDVWVSGEDIAQCRETLAAVSEEHLGWSDQHHYIPAARLRRIIDENAEVAGLVEALELARDSVEAVYRHHRERFGSDDPATRTMAKKLTTVQQALAAYHEGSK